MRRSTRRVIAVMGLVTGLLGGFGASPPAEAAPGCGRLDRPETGTAGDVPLADQLSGRADLGYSCGLALVGYSSLGGRGGNANMAWAGDCAYVSGDGIAVVDVRDPEHPEHISTLHGPGSDASVETLHAVVAPDRAILVAGRYGLFGMTGFGSAAPIDVYDVSDCRHPVLLSSFALPSNAHNLTLSADAKTMWNDNPNQLDQAWAHSRYVPETGHIWLATRSGGFWVLELEPQVRATLGLPSMPARYPEGREPRPPATRLAVATAAPTGLYCTLDVTGSALRAVLPT